MLFREDAQDDPQGEGLKAVTRAMELIDNGTEVEQDIVRALFVLYNRDAIPDSQERDTAYLNELGRLHEKYPADPDIASMYAAAYMSMGRWNYWLADGTPRPGTEAAEAALISARRRWRRCSSRRRRSSKPTPSMPASSFSA